MSDLWSKFGYPLAAGGEDSEPLMLTTEAQAELETALAEIREAHAAALQSAHKVVVWR